MEEGASGFVKGVGRGLVGVVTQPVSGTLGLASRTAEGFAASGKAVRSNAASAFRGGFGGKGGRLTRVRLPRAAAPDGVLRPFESESARGQHLMRIAERGAYLGAADPFRRRGRYRADVFLDIVDVLPGGHVAVLTNRRVLFLKRQNQRGGDGANDDENTPCVAVWDIRWENVLAVELASSSSSSSSSLSSQSHSRSSSLVSIEATPAPAPTPDAVVLHLKQPSKGHHGIFDGRRNHMTRHIQCTPGTSQALRTWETIHRLQRELGGSGGGGGGSFHAGAGATGESSLDGWEGFDGDNVSTAASDARHQAPPLDEAAAAWDAAGNVPMSASIRPPTLPCLDYRLVWDSGASSGRVVNGPPRATIWEPVCALPGYVALGHVVEPGADPPGSPVAVYFNDQNPGDPAAASPPLLARPLRYELVWRRTSAPALTLWHPIAPAGYVAVGSVAVSGSDRAPSEGAGGEAGVGWCVRDDAVHPTVFFTGAAWTCADNGGKAGGGGVTLFQVDNDAFTFVATRGGERDRPGAHLAVAIDATKVTTTTTTTS